jgi:asparagine N-glycosylation enzyme membrane subunit Stt3
MADPQAGPPGDGSATRPAWYAASPGTWRDWVSVLHLPYTAWHLSYVLIGASLAPVLSVERLNVTLVAFALAVGVAAHGFDELHGRPLGTSIGAPALAGVSAIALAGSVSLGVAGITRVGWGLAGFIAAGIVLVVAYNLEPWGGRFHNDAIFALSWGAFPVLVAYYAQTATVRPAAVVGAAFAYGLSRAQRSLSTEARDLRRRVLEVAGQKTYRDGSRSTLSRQALLQPIEKGLVALSWCTCALGVAMVLARTGH